MSSKASLSSLVLEVGWNVTDRTVRPRLHSTLCFFQLSEG